MSSDSSYTMFAYLHRDASNYKAFNWLLLSGSYSQVAEETIAAACDSGQFFVAEQVGIPALYDQVPKDANGSVADLHAFHEFDGIWQVSNTENLPVWGSLDDLIDRFKKAQDNWDVRLSPYCY